MRKNHHYYLVNKPYGYLSQFTSTIPSHQTLGQLYDFPSDVYPVGRLDRDSEGLIILTNDTTINTRLLHPKHEHTRRYWVQVEGTPESKDLESLSSGVSIKLKKQQYQTRCCKVQDINPTIPERVPPIRFRKSVPTSWLEIQLTEGKNRQVRKMCAAIGFPVLRLIRVGIENLQLPSLKIGITSLEDRVQKINKTEIYKKLLLHSEDSN